METLFIYLVKSSGLLALFFISYFFMLRKETFFTSNRWFLLAGLFTSVILPLIVYTKVIWVEPVVSTMDWSTIPVTHYVEEKTFVDYLPLILVLVYGLGILVLLAKFLYDFYSLRKLLKGKLIQRQADFKLVDTKENLAPFSFFNTIVYNSTLYSPAELENILEHEKIHSEQNHTVDVLISRVFCILFWFNPIIWLHKKAILQNLEFIADSEATKNTTDKKAYQITLLKITTQENCVAITNHFYQSLIKKRIVMLNKNQSKKRNSWKYAIVIPALVAFVILFQVKVVAQEKIREVRTLSKSDEISSENSVKGVTDTVKRTKTITIHSSQNRNHDEVTDIYIDGKKVSQSELDKLDPSIIKTMDVNKNGTKNTIKINTKNSNELPEETEIYIDGKRTNQSELDGLDPSEIKNMDVNKHKRIIKIVTKNSTALPDGTEIYIDGKKVDQKELDNLDQTLIERMDVHKDNSNTSKKKTIQIITKNRNNIEESKIDAEQIKKEIKKAKREIKKAKHEIELARVEIERVKPEIEKAKMEVEKIRK